MPVNKRERRQFNFFRSFEGELAFDKQQGDFQTSL